jgi:hypothetical protein
MKLSELLDRLEEDADRAAMLAQTVKNPDTDQDITVKTALTYDKEHPARKAAARIYAQFMNKNKPAATPAQKPAFRPTPNRRPQVDPWDQEYGDDAYDAQRDYKATGDRNILPKKPAPQDTSSLYGRGRFRRFR